MAHPASLGRKLLSIVLILSQFTLPLARLSALDAAIGANTQNLLHTAMTYPSPERISIWDESPELGAASDEVLQNAPLAQSTPTYIYPTHIVESANVTNPLYTLTADDPGGIPDGLNAARMSATNGCVVFGFSGASTSTLASQIKFYGAMTGTLDGSGSGWYVRGYVSDQPLSCNTSSGQLVLQQGAGGGTSYLWYGSAVASIDPAYPVRYLKLVSRRAFWVDAVRIYGSFSPEINPDPLAGDPEEGCQDPCYGNSPVAQTQTAVGRPINPYTGNYTYSNRDLAVPVNGQSLVFRRIYSAHRLNWTNPSQDVMGAGWTHNYQLRLYTDAVGNITFQDSTGARHLFYAQPGGGYLAANGFLAVLTRTGVSGNYTYALQLADQTTYTFNHFGYATQIQTPNGSPVSLTYYDSATCGATCRLERVQSGSRYLHFVYHTSGPETGLLREVHDQRGGSAAGMPYVEYSYADVSGTGSYQLSTVRDLGGADWNYDYQTTAPYRLTRVTDPLDNVPEEQAYDSSGRVVAQTYGFGRTPQTPGYLRLPLVSLEYLSSSTTRVTDGEGNTYLYVYTPAGALDYIENIQTGERVHDPDFSGPQYRPEAQTDLYDNTTLLQWSEDGQRLLAVTNAVNQTTSLGYNTANNTITSVTDPLGRNTSFAYTDPANPTLPTLVTDALSQQTSLTYTAEGYLETITDAQGIVTRFAYDAFGQRTQMITHYIDGVYSPAAPDEDLTTQFAYDAAGRLTTIIDPIGRQTHMTYDGAGKITLSVRNYVDGVYDPAFPDRDLGTAYGYDAAGRLISTQDVLGRVTRYDYDFDGRLIRTTRNFTDGTYQPAVPDEDIHVSYEYDRNGNVVATRDVLGKIDRTCYDSLNRPTRTVVNFVDPSGTLDPCTLSRGTASDQNLITDTEYGIDLFGRRYTDRINHLGHRNRTVYDKLNRVTHVIHNYQDGIHDFLTDPVDVDVITQTVYDGAGNVERVIDPLGRTTWFCYDNLNRRIRQVNNATGNASSPQTHPCDSGSYSASTDADKDIITLYSYDTLGRLVQSQDALGRLTRYEYDALGRNTRTITNYVDGIFDPLFPALDVIHENVYDSAGRLTESRELQAPGSYRITRYVYDLADRQTQTIRNFGQALTETHQRFYDGLGRLMMQVDPAGASTQFSYDGVDRLITVTDALGHSHATLYNGLHMVGIIDPMGMLTQFTYDGVYRQTSTASAMGFIATRVYDALGRLAGISDANGIASRYSYDALGRMTGVIENTGLTTPPPFVNNPAFPDQHIQTAYVYDIAGNLLSMALPAGGVVTYAYDGLNRRTVVDGPRTDIADLWITHYDKGGRQIQVQYPNVHTATFLYTPLDQLRRIDYSDGTPSVEYSFDSLGRRTQMLDGVGTTTYQYDALDRILSITDPYLETLQYSYDAAGRRNSLTLPGNRTVNYQYDSAGRMTGVADWDLNTPDVSYTYDAASRITAMQLPNGVTASFDYDQDGRMTALEYLQDATLLMRIDYTLDNVGNRVLAREQLGVVEEGPTCDAVAIANDSSDLVQKITAAISASQSSGNMYTICLPEASTYTLTNYHNITTGRNAFPVIANGSLVSIVGLGSGATITRSAAGTSFRFFHVQSGGGLTLENITLSNGYVPGADTAGAGGAVFNVGNLLIKDSLLSGNRANTQAGAIYSTGVAQLEDTDVLSNIATTDAGAIMAALTGQIEIIRGEIRNNSANASSGRGGAIYLNGGSVRLEDVLLQGNTAFVGGGVYVTKSASAASVLLEIEGGSRFIENISGGGSGGGLYSTGSGVTVINDALFSGNRTTGVGAGIWSAGTLTIADSSFLNNGNTSDSGTAGAIYSSGTLSLSGSRIEGNLIRLGTGARGGGVYIAGGTASIHQTEFIANQAGNGAGLYTVNSVTTVTNSTFQGNIANHNGGAINNNTRITVSDSVFTENDDAAGGEDIYSAAAHTNKWVATSCFVNTNPADSGVFSTTANFDAKNNWWGSASGPTAGQTNSNIVSSPFLTDGCPPSAGAQGMMSAAMAAAPQFEPLMQALESEAVEAGEPLAIPYLTEFATEEDWSLSGSWIHQMSEADPAAGGWWLSTINREETSTLTLSRFLDLRQAQAPQLRYTAYGEIAPSDLLWVELRLPEKPEWILVDVQGAPTLQVPQAEHRIDLSAYRGQLVQVRLNVTSGAELGEGEQTRGIWLERLLVHDLGDATEESTSEPEPTLTETLVSAEPTLAESTAEVTVEPTAEPLPTLVELPTATPSPNLAALPFIQSFDSADGWQPSEAWTWTTTEAFLGGAWMLDAGKRPLESTLTYAGLLDLRSAQTPLLNFWQRAALAPEDRVMLELRPLDQVDWLLVDEQPGTSSSWTLHSVDLTPYVGQIYALRLRVTTGEVPTLDARRFGGFWLDEMAIAEARPSLPTAQPSPAPSATPTLPAPELSAEPELTVEVQETPTLAPSATPEALPSAESTREIAPIIIPSETPTPVPSVTPEPQPSAEGTAAVEPDFAFVSADYDFALRQLLGDPPPSGEARTTVYTYDGLYRLTNARECDGLLSSAACTATTPAVEYRYAYDLMGNRTRAETITASATQLTNYTYNIANQLMSDGAQSFSYDANGRLISAGDRSYSYALNDRLIALSQPGLSATFAYNGDGVRLAQTTNGSATRYLVDTQRKFSGEVVAAIAPESETWYLLGLDVLGQQQGSDWSYYAYDGLGSVRLALDSSGGPSAGMRYEPYGQPAASWGTPPALGFTGEWTDSSGLLYLRARYLDPSSATFLSRDPFEGLPTRALSRNGYSWVEGNPVMRVDPSGMCWDHPLSTDAQRTQCLDAWNTYVLTHDLGDPTIRELLRQEDAYWGSLSYDDFVQLWNDNLRRPPSSSNNLQSTGEILIAGGSVLAISDGLLPVGDLVLLAGLCVTGVAVVAKTLQLIQLVTLSDRPYYDFSQNILEYRLNGFDEKVGTLAEHLAKILGRDVAGYPPSGPNPDDRATRVWCTTVRRVVRELENAGYTEKQLDRDLEKAGIGIRTWNEIVLALSAARNLCNDHWGDFTGGSLSLR